MKANDRYYSDDITWCMAECDTDCPRKPKYIRDKTIPHSYADFSKNCMAYDPKQTKIHSCSECKDKDECFDAYTEISQYCGAQTEEPYEYEIKALHKDYIEPYVIIEDEQTDCPWK